MLIFTAGGEDLTKLPGSRIELYELGIESAVTQRLVPTGYNSSDALISMWLRLFNLDRSAVTMTAVATTGTEQKKEREHRGTRKAALSMELKDQGLQQVDQGKTDQGKAEDDKKAGGKKKAAEASQAAKGENRKLLSLDVKEVYEVFKHGAHYLREANKPEVQRTELNRIELSMPKKLVDTVMMLVNANLKMLLGGRAQGNGLSMLRQVAVANQEAGRREFASNHVAKALLIDQVNPEGMTLWLHLNKEEAGLPLTKTLEAQTEVAPAQYQFKHLSFQEGLFAQHLLMQAELGWEGWETDESAAAFLNNPFMNNTCRIAAGLLGTRLAAKRPAWNFSGSGSKLSEVGLMALWLICERNAKLKILELVGNKVGATKDDAHGLSRMLSTSTVLETLDLGSNQVLMLPCKSDFEPPSHILASRRLEPLPSSHRLSFLLRSLAPCYHARYFRLAVGRAEDPPARSRPRPRRQQDPDIPQHERQQPLSRRHSSRVHRAAHVPEPQGARPLVQLTRARGFAARPAAIPQDARVDWSHREGAADALREDLVARSPCQGGDWTLAACYARAPNVLQVRCLLAHRHHPDAHMDVAPQGGCGGAGGGAAIQHCPSDAQRASKRGA